MSEKEFDVPLILAVRDHLGRVWGRNELTRGGAFCVLHLNGRKEYYLYPGDELVLEVEVDPSFDPAVPYVIRWWWAAHLMPDREFVGPRVVIPLDERHIGEDFSVECTVTTTRAWHRRHGNDDHLNVRVKVLPSR